MTPIERCHSRVHWNKRKFLHKKRVQLPQEHQYGRRDVMRKRSIELRWPADMQIYCDKTKVSRKKRCSTPTALNWDNNMATVFVLGYQYGGRDGL